MELDQVLVFIIMWKTQVTEEELGYVCGSERFTKLITEHFAVANVLIFETTGSFMISYGFVIYGGYSTDPQYPYLYSVLTFGFYFASLLWSARYCSPSLNPAITLAKIINSPKQMPLLMGCLYLACQFFGILCGSVLGFTLTSNHAAPAMDYLSTAVLSGDEVTSFFQSFLSSFAYMVIILLMTTPAYSFTEVDLQVWFSMPLIYGITSLLGKCPLGTNFLLTLIVAFLSGCYSDSFIILKSAWGLILGPLLGCLVGSIFFQYFYKPVAEAFKEELAEEIQQARDEEEERRRWLQRESVLQIM